MKHVLIRECEICTTAFEAERSTKRFCSDACRQHHYRIAYRHQGDDSYRNAKASKTPEMGNSTGEGENGDLAPSQTLRKPRFPVTLKSKSRTPSPVFKGRLKFEKINDVTWKLTDGSMTRNPGSLGQWGGWDSTKALAWVVNVHPLSAEGKARWVAYCRDRQYSADSLPDAKRAAKAMVLGEEPYEEIEFTERA
jgi:hypothetical protein